MKLKAQEIYNMYEAITALSQEKTAMPTAYYIAKNTKIIKEEATAIDEARQKLIMDFGEKKEDGSLNTLENGTVKIEDNKLPMFNEQMVNLFNAEVELDIKKIPLSTLNQINIPIASIEKLLPIIIDDLETDNCCDCNCENSCEATIDENGQILSIN